MKKKLLCALACLTLVLGTGGLTSCDNDTQSVTPYTISDLLVYDRLAGEFDLTGQKVSLENVMVTSTHGNTITVAESDSATAIEVVLTDDSPSATMETLVNVTGTMNTYHGRAQISDATIETVDSNQQSFYYTTGFSRASGFDSYGRTESGMIGGGMTAAGLKPVKFKIISYNGATEYKEGEDLLLTVAYQGTDYTDPYNWLTLVLFGDSDEATIAYYNAFFFGTDSMVSWTSPFSSGRSDRSIIAAGWEGLEAGVEDGDFMSCELIHFFYDEEYNPDYGSMFFLDNVCLPYADSLELYNEESDLGNALAALNEAFETGNAENATYTNTVTYNYLEGDEISLAEYYSMSSAAYNRYMNNLTLASTDTFVLTATPSYFLFEEIYDFEGETAYQAYAEVNYDDEGATITHEYLFDEQEEFEAFVAILEGGEGDISSYSISSTYNYAWTDMIATLYDLTMYQNSFHQTGTVCDYNDDSINDNLWDALNSFMFGDADYYYENYYDSYQLSSLTYNSSTQTMKANYDFGAWYYGDSTYTTVIYLDEQVIDSVQFNLTSTVDPN